MLNTGAFSQNCDTWNGVDTYVDGTTAVDDFVFEIGEDGQAAAVDFVAFGYTMEKNANAGQVRRRLVRKM